MGTHGFASNRKKQRGEYKRNKVHRQKRAERKRVKGEKTGEINDVELMTVNHLKKRRTSPRANITLSGKKKRKLLKQLKHMQDEKNKMEVIEEVKVKKGKKVKVHDVEMQSDEEEEEKSGAEENLEGSEEMQE